MKAQFTGCCSEQQSAIFGNTLGNAVDDAAIGQLNFHRLALIYMQALPFLPKGRETITRERLQDSIEFHQQYCQYPVAFRHDSAGRGNIDRRLVNPLEQCPGCAAVKSNPDDSCARSQHFALHFDENSREFAAAPKHVIWPFKSRFPHAALRKRARHRESNRETQAGHETRALLESPQQ